MLMYNIIILNVSLFLFLLSNPSQNPVNFTSWMSNMRPLLCFHHKLAEAFSLYQVMVVASYLSFLCLIVMQFILLTGNREI